MIILDGSARGYPASSSPTYRRTEPSNFEPVGVDTVTIRGALTDYDDRQVRLLRRVDADGVLYERVTGTRYDLPSGIALTVDFWNNQRPDGRVEFSVPRYLHRTNLVPASVSDVRDALDMIYADSADFVRWAGPPDTLRVTRLDLARDFKGVTEIPRLLDRLHLTRGQRAGKSARWADNNRGGAETLTRGFPRQWRANLYDKQHEVLSRVRREKHPLRLEELLADAEQAMGRLRFEVQLRLEALKTNHLRLIGDVTNVDLSEVAGQYFCRAGFDAPVGGRTEIERALADMSASPDFKYVQAVLGQLLLDSLAVEATSAPNTVRRYRGIARKYNLSPATLGLTVEAPMRLDFATGRLVA